MPYWFATFPTLKIQGVDYLQTNGVEPSVAIVRALPENSYVPSTGTLSFYGQSVDNAAAPVGQASLLFALPDMAVDHTSLKFTQEPIGPGNRWLVRMVDRRWKWHRGEFSATYNERLTDQQQQTRSGVTQANAREIAAKIFDAMGEVGYDVSLVPNTVYPHVSWYKVTPAYALADLMARLNFHVCPQTSTNTFALVPHNTGNDIDTTVGLRNPDYAWTEADRPANIRIQCGPTLYQAVFKMQAVGVDTDGTIKPISSLTYTPSGGWLEDHPYAFQAVAEANRHLALETVYRWYQVEEYAVTGLTISDGPVALSNINRTKMLPARVAAANNTAFDELFSRRPRIIGRFYPFSFHGEAPTSQEPFAYNGPFEWDPQRRLVKFPHPMVNWSSSQFVEADLWVEVGFQALDAENAPEAYYRQLAIGGTGPDEVYRFSDTWLRLIADYTPQNSATGWLYSSVDSNQTALNTELDIYLAELAKLHTGTKADVTYSGITPYDLNGKIHQAHYSIGSGKPAQTRVSRGMELSLYHRGPRIRRLEGEGILARENATYESA